MSTSYGCYVAQDSDTKVCRRFLKRSITPELSSPTQSCSSYSMPVTMRLSLTTIGLTALSQDFKISSKTLNFICIGNQFGKKLQGNRQVISQGEASAI